MNLQELNEQLDAVVLKGDIVNAVDLFYAVNVATNDHTGAVVSSKAGQRKKMEDFLAGIAKVNGITKHHSAVHGDISFSEFTFDFDMKDGSKIYWHEILRRQWKEGKVVAETYFLA